MSVSEYQKLVARKKTVEDKPMDKPKVIPFYHDIQIMNEPVILTHQQQVEVSEAYRRETVKAHQNYVEEMKAGGYKCLM